MHSSIQSFISTSRIYDGTGTHIMLILRILYWFRGSCSTLEFYCLNGFRMIEDILFSYYSAYVHHGTAAIIVAVMVRINSNEKFSYHSYVRRQLRRRRKQKMLFRNEKLLCSLSNKHRILSDCIERLTTTTNNENYTHTHTYFVEKKLRREF